MSSDLHTKAHSKKTSRESIQLFAKDNLKETFYAKWFPSFFKSKTSVDLDDYPKKEPSDDTLVNLRNEVDFYVEDEVERLNKKWEPYRVSLEYTLNDLSQQEGHFFGYKDQHRARQAFVQKMKATHKPHKKKQFASLVFHGTSTKSVPEILDTGFKEPDAKISKRLAYGPGIYLTTDLERALSYSRFEMTGTHSMTVLVFAVILDENDFFFHKKLPAEYMVSLNREALFPLAEVTFSLKGRSTDAERNRIMMSIMDDLRKEPYGSTKASFQRIRNCSLKGNCGYYGGKQKSRTRKVR